MEVHRRATGGELVNEPFSLPAHANGARNFNDFGNMTLNTSSVGAGGHRFGAMIAYVPFASVSNVPVRELGCGATDS